MDNPTDERMSFTSHLEELRTRLIRILAAVGIGFLACYGFKDWLFKIITKPLADVLPAKSFMIYTGMPEAFFIYMQIAFFASLLLTGPYCLYQVWKFISPGLYREKKNMSCPLSWSPPPCLSAACFSAISSSCRRPSSFLCLFLPIFSNQCFL